MVKPLNKRRKRPFYWDDPLQAKRCRQRFRKKRTVWPKKKRKRRRRKPGKRRRPWRKFWQRKKHGYKIHPSCVVHLRDPIQKIITYRVSQLPKDSYIDPPQTSYGLPEVFGRVNVPLIRRAFVESLYGCYRGFYAPVNCKPFVKKIKQVLLDINLEDLSQELEVCRIYAKQHPDPVRYWSQYFYTNVIMFIKNYKIDRPVELLDQDIVRSELLPSQVIFCKLNRFNYQLVALILQGYRLQDLAEFYRVGWKTVVYWVETLNSQFLDHSSSSDSPPPS